MPDHEIHCGRWLCSHPSPVIVYLLVEPHWTMVYRSGYAEPSPKNKPAPKTSRREMITIEKGILIAFFYCLRNIALVAQIVGRPWSTIKSFLAWACERLSLYNHPRPGHPSLLSHEQRLTIIWAAKSNRKITRCDFWDKYAPGVSLSTGNKNKPGILVVPWVIAYDFS